MQCSLCTYVWIESLYVWYSCTIPTSYPSIMEKGITYWNQCTIFYVLYHYLNKCKYLNSLHIPKFKDQIRWWMHCPCFTCGWKEHLYVWYTFIVPTTHPSIMEKVSSIKSMDPSFLCYIIDEIHATTWLHRTSPNPKINSSNGISVCVSLFEIPTVFQLHIHP